MSNADPATTARKIGLQLFKLQLANRDIGREIERLQVELESIDFSALPSPRQRKPRRRVKVTRAVIEYRAGLLSIWQRYKKAEAVRGGWESGDKENWHKADFAAAHAKSFNESRVYEWLRGESDVDSAPALAIEGALNADIEAMKTAGIDPNSVLA